MSPRNLATVLSPTLLYSKDANVATMVITIINLYLKDFLPYNLQLEEMEKANAIVRFLIQEFKEIFPEKEIVMPAVPESSTPAEKAQENKEAAMPVQVVTPPDSPKLTRAASTTGFSQSPSTPR